MPEVLGSCKVSPKIALVVLGFLLVILVLMNSSPQKDSVELIEEISLENHKSLTTREFVTLPENVTRLTSKRWAKKSREEINNVTYDILSHPIKLKIYEFDPANPITKEYILSLQLTTANFLENQSLSSVTVGHYSSSAMGDYIDIFEKDNQIFLIAYDEESITEARDVVVSIIAGEVL